MPLPGLTVSGLFGNVARFLRRRFRFSMGWPEVIDDLTKERTQAVTCVGLIKSSGDQHAPSTDAKLTYGTARAEMDGVIAGLTTALVEGGEPDRLPTVRTSLETSGKGLKEICDAAPRRLPPTRRACGKRSPRGRSNH